MEFTCASLIKLYYQNKNKFRIDIVEYFNMCKQNGRESDINITFINILRSNTIELEDFILMVKYGADPKYDNYIAFIYSCGYSNADIAIYLINIYGFNEIVKNNLSLIINYAYMGCSNILKLLLENNVDPNMLLSVGINTPEKIQLLLDHNININLFLQMCGKKFPCIDSAEYLISILPQYVANYTYDKELLNKVLRNYISHSREPKLESIRILVEHGADPNSTDDLPLVHIISKKMEENLTIKLLDYLINSCNYDINVNNSSALCTAISYDKMAVIVFLLELGSEISDGCIEYAINSERCLDLLIQYGISLDKICQVFMSKMPNRWLIKKLIDNGIDITNIITNL